LRAKALEDEDRELCASFQCGDELYEGHVAQWIAEWIWSKPSKHARTVIVLDDDEGALVAFGTWDFVDVALDGVISKHIEIAWFGVDARYQGRTTESSERVADVAYATVETAATSDLQATDDMKLMLECHADNVRGLAFWRRQGFQAFAEAVVEDGDESRPYIRMVR
jgi:GNAT superfamily N-acetyltransferase